MKSKYFPIVSLKAFVYGMCGIIFLVLGIISLVFISVFIGKIISALSLFGFAGMFISMSVFAIVSRKKILSDFYCEEDFSSKSITRKIIFLADNTIDRDSFSFKNKFNALENRLKKDFLFEKLEDWLSIEIKKTVNPNCYKPYVFVMIRENGSVINKYKKVICGFQDANWLEISYDQNQSLSPIFLHEMGHLILSGSGFKGDQHPIIQAAIQRDKE